MSGKYQLLLRIYTYNQTQKLCTTTATAFGNKFKIFDTYSDSVSSFTSDIFQMSTLKQIIEF